MPIGKKIFLDTNFWLRYFLADNKIQYQSSQALADKIEVGKYFPFTSAIVFLEINFVLSKIYKLPQKLIYHYYDVILAVRNITIIDKTNLIKALEYHHSSLVKLPDCLIASSLPKNCTMVSWDKDFSKIKDIKTLTPKDLLI